MKNLLKTLAIVGIVAGMLVSIKVALEIMAVCSKKYYIVENGGESSF